MNEIDVWADKAIAAMLERVVAVVIWEYRQLILELRRE